MKNLTPAQKKALAGLALAALVTVGAFFPVSEPVLQPLLDAIANCVSP